MAGGRPRSAETRERDARALGMKQRGLSLSQICKELGFRSKSGAHEAVQRALMDCYREEREQDVQLAYERLNDLLRTYYRIMATKHYVVAERGKIVIDPRTKLPLIDDGPVMQAAAGARAVIADLRKMLGTDEPTRARVTVITDEDLRAEESRLDKAIEDLTAEMAERDAAAADPGVV